MGEIRDYLNSDRRDFEREALELESMDVQPWKQFSTWLEEAKAYGVKEPYALCLSSISQSGYPSSRMLYLRDLSEEGLIVYTNYNSAKGQELGANAKAAMNFHWQEMDRQIRVWGDVEQVEPAISDAYFAQRPKASQIGAWASQQSEALESRAALEARVKQLEEDYADTLVPRPPHWGGYRLKPVAWEFWQGRASRLHDRFKYEQEGGAWRITRLNP